MPGDHVGYREPKPGQPPSLASMSATPLEPRFSSPVCYSVAPSFLHLWHLAKTQKAMTAAAVANISHRTPGSRSQEHPFPQGCLSAPARANSIRCKLSKLSESPSPPPLLPTCAPRTRPPGSQGLQCQWPFPLDNGPQRCAPSTPHSGAAQAN